MRTIHRLTVPLIVAAVLPAFGQEPVDYETYLRRSAVNKQTLDVFLDPKEVSWAKFDPVTGYKLGYYLPRDGIDRSFTISTAQSAGMRTQHVFADKPCRINTYGNSFTQCHQVSDAETWQEYLGAHLGEPVRNYGMGGFGVYQAYRRMIRVEQTGLGGEYVVLYIWGDDHIRSLLRCRHASIYAWWDHDRGRMFHNNFWANIEMDLDSGRIVERENMLPTPESLYKMTDPDFMVDALKDDLALRMLTYHQDLVADIDVSALHRLAGHLGFDAGRLTSPTPPRQAVRDLLTAYSLEGTKYILTKARAFTDAHKKKLLVILFDPSRVMRPMLSGEKTRYDQPVVNFLKDNEYRYFDMNLIHTADYKQFNLTIDQYIKRYFIGHYSPSGNHFFAYAIKDTVVDWLEPKPITYHPSDDRWISFDGYLPP